MESIGQIRDVRSSPKVDQITAKCAKSGTFSDQIQYILAWLGEIPDMRSDNSPRELVLALSSVTLILVLPGGMLMMWFSPGLVLVDV